MNETDPSAIWDNLSDQEKQLAREYIKATLQAKAAKIALEDLINDEINDESTARLAEEFLIKEGNLQYDGQYY